MYESFAEHGFPVTGATAGVHAVCGSTPIITIEILQALERVGDRGRHS
jgi:hypothetical protein